jgi:recombination protein RecA
MTKDTLDIVVKTINKIYGEGAATSFNEVPKIQPEDIIKTGSINLDLALGIGGYRRGRIVEIIGQEQSGKTTAALHAVANVQKQGQIAAYIDAEHSLDLSYCQTLGVDLSKMILSQPDYGEQGLDIAKKLAETGEVALIVIDSVAALTPKAELDGEIIDNHVGRQARMMSQAMRMITGAAANTNTTILFLNQFRSKINVMYGNPNIGTGGNALKYYASHRLEIRRIGDVKLGDKVVGNRTKVKVLKNKLSAPFKEAEFDLIFGKGIDQDSELLDLAVEDGIIKKSGAWFSYEENNIGQGKANTLQWLKDTPKTLEKIKEEVLSNRGIE